MSKVKLSECIRPNSEAAPWVIAEIKKLEAQVTPPEKPEEFAGIVEYFENLREYLEQLKWWKSTDG